LALMLSCSVACRLAPLIPEKPIFGYSVFDVDGQ
jgi:hypothetical protein